VVGGGFVELVGELELPALLVVELLPRTELVLQRDRELAVLGDHLLDVAGEPVVGVDLLLDETVLPEVAVQDLPEVGFLHLATHQYYLNNTTYLFLHNTPATNHTQYNNNTIYKLPRSKHNYLQGIISI
jgi:hypothetical protein